MSFVNKGAVFLVIPWITLFEFTKGNVYMGVIPLDKQVCPEGS